MQPSHSRSSIDLETTLNNDNCKNLKLFYTNLQETAAKSSIDLQTHVFRNYPEFVVIAQEISQLETDLFELKEGLSELHIAVDAFSSDVTSTGSNSALSGNKDGQDAKSTPEPQEAGSLDETNRKELAKVWKIVQGSREYLPYVQDRRPLLESAGWKELDHASYRSKRDAHFFLLTDSLLVATRAKRQTIIDIKHAHGSKAGLIARTCFKLAELALSDVKDSAESKDAFKIVCKNEVYVFSARTKAEKQKLLRAIVRATNDHFRQLKQRALLETTKKVGEALDAVETNSLHSIKPEGNRRAVAPILGSDFWDGLDVFIAHHQYKDAVDFITDAQAAWKEYSESSENKTEEAPYTAELQKRSDTVAALLEHRILEADTKSSMKTFVSQLIRLGLTNRAQLAFLSARHRQMHRRVRQLELDGNTVHFVDALSQAVFGMVSHSCLWYAEFFPARIGTSQLVAWVSEEMELFGKAYRRQVHCIPPLPQDIIDVCYSTASNHARQLHSVGLNLNFMLDRLISPV
ncbi:exocyst complex component exo84, variant 2 [Entomophthora muscae]|uniref:Exocyst complex component exo84, variant 2 n=1 Tax=Entomophthora muscae TaxID=34485 RepID=A0ACC2SYX3_9FUNG|nr:exocyst complex component exo84, variant 2 [Entomophthora muscae]